MKYKGIEIQPINECKVFEEPREMLVWNENDTRPIEKLVCAIIPYRREGSVITRGGAFEYCAEIPEEPKPRRATNIELMKWLAKGNGMVKSKNEIFAGMGGYNIERLNNTCGEWVKVRKWDDTEWHEPTVDYMGIE